MRDDMGRYLRGSLREGSKRTTHRELRGYSISWLGIDPGPEHRQIRHGFKKRQPIVPLPQTEAQRVASEADDLTWEEFLGRR